MVVLRGLRAALAARQRGRLADRAGRAGREQTAPFRHHSSARPPRRRPVGDCSTHAPRRPGCLMVGELAFADAIAAQRGVNELLHNAAVTLFTTRTAVLALSTFPLRPRTDGPRRSMARPSSAQAPRMPDAESACCGAIPSGTRQLWRNPVRNGWRNRMRMSAGFPTTRSRPYAASPRRARPGWRVCTAGRDGRKALLPVVLE
jgi:hypothetical protein